jgi:hypothetical protein
MLQVRQQLTALRADMGDAWSQFLSNSATTLFATLGPSAGIGGALYARIFVRQKR